MNHLIPALASPSELAIELGRLLRLARAVRGLSPEDMARLNQVSAQALDDLESGEPVDLITFLSVAKALGMIEDVLDSCQPAPQSLDEIELLNAAHLERSSRLGKERP